MRAESTEFIKRLQTVGAGCQIEVIEIVQSNSADVSTLLHGAFLCKTASGRALR